MIDFFLESCFRLFFAFDSFLNRLSVLLHGEDFAGVYQGFCGGFLFCFLAVVKA
jgi:hypothetical protein